MTPSNAQGRPRAVAAAGLRSESEGEELERYVVVLRLPRFPEECGWTKAMRAQFGYTFQ